MRYNAELAKRNLCPIDCGDNSCICAEEKKGMRTNGGCRCEEKELRIAVRYWKNKAIELDKDIQSSI